MTAVIYARYSSDNQREESIEGQIRECTAYAEKNGITVLDFLNAHLQGCMELVIGHDVSVQSRRSLRQGQREGNAARQGDLAQVHINGSCHRDAELLQYILGLLLNGGVDTKIECHRFFHGYHLGFIVTYFALQVNSR